VFPLYPMAPCSLYRLPLRVLSILYGSVFSLQAVTPCSCCILRGPGGERIVDVVPGGTELELLLRRGVRQGVHTRNNPHVNCRGVYWL